MSEALQMFLGDISETHTLRNELDFYELAQEGLPIYVLNNTIKNLHLSKTLLSRVIGISPRHLGRYLKEETLPMEVSTNLLQLVKVSARAIEVFEDKEIAVEWLMDNNESLKFKKPIDLISNSFGVESVFKLLGRIEHGIF